MNYRGLLRGNTIELAERLPFPDGQPLRISVEPWSVPPPAGSAQAIRQAMHAPPHLGRGAVDELEKAIGAPVCVRGRRRKESQAFQAAISVKLLR